MEVRLKPELEQFLKGKIESGEYQTLDEAINRGIELLRNQEEIYLGRYEELKREIMIGVLASERGELIESKEVFQRLQQKLENYGNQENNE